MKKKKRSSVRLSSKDTHIASFNHNASTDPYSDPKNEENIN